MNLTDAILMFQLKLPCSEEDILKQHKRLLLKYHPDKNVKYEKWCHQRIMEISQAKDILQKNKTQSMNSPWKIHYQEFSEKEKENSPKEPPITNKNYYMEEIHQIMQTYYQYGLENYELRHEGVRRFRYREVHRNLKKLAAIFKKRELLETSQYHFIKSFFSYMVDPIPSQDLSGTNQARRAFFALRDSVNVCEKIMKQYFLNKKQDPIQRFIGSMKIIIVISGSYPKQNWTGKAQQFIELTEAFLALLNIKYH